MLLAVILHPRSVVDRGHEALERVVNASHMNSVKVFAEFQDSCSSNISTMIVCLELRTLGSRGRAATYKSNITAANTKRRLEWYESGQHYAFSLLCYGVPNRGILFGNPIAESRNGVCLENTF
ncbi:hypothetical protein NPIL_160931 [Nephila pilipes]|uniref:Uncharacterized protein n=1 Tax=Nephila pilipes TaxID=299642 RepID=A0A8X6NC61_NEPPI|nr:hypothetical protein NPIL_160931 [Nephila pilipes]